MASYCWHRHIYNGYEPDNKIKFKAELINDREYQPFEMSGFLSFKDGTSIIYIRRNEDGTFDWRNDDRNGQAARFEEAWQNMPALVSKPDHYEESEIWEEN